MIYAVVDADGKVTGWTRYQSFYENGDPVPNQVQMEEDDPRIVEYDRASSVQA